MKEGCLYSVPELIIGDDVSVGIFTYDNGSVKKIADLYEPEDWGCFNYALTYFGTSFPEVTDIRENKDGTVTLTVDAVCSMILCDDNIVWC